MYMWVSDAQVLLSYSTAAAEVPRPLPIKSNPMLSSTSLLVVQDLPYITLMLVQPWALDQPLTLIQVQPVVLVQ
jgi:hypothetical protein